MANEQIDLLISRVIDRRATSSDWTALESMAGRDPSVWRELAGAMKIDQDLSSFVEHEVNKSRHVNITVERVVRHDAATDRRGLNARRIASWGGWIAAAVLVAFSMRGTPTDPGAKDTSVAGISGSTRDFLSNYLQSGKQDGSVVGEMPEKVLLNTTPAEDGGTYVIFIRQIVEKVKVDDLYRISTDETGRPTPVRIADPAPKSRGPAM